MVNTKKTTKTPKKAAEPEARGRSKSPKMMTTRSKTPAKAKKSPSPAPPKSGTKRGKSPAATKKTPAKAKKSPSPAPKKAAAEKKPTTKRASSKTPKKEAAAAATATAATMPAEPKGTEPAPATPVTASDKSEKPASTFLGTYMSLMDKYPYLMNALQGSILISGSVVTAQYIATPANSAFVVDTIDVAVMVTILICLITPLLMWWGPTLDSLPIGNLPPALAKVAYDQFLFSPVLTFLIVASRLLLLRSVPPMEVPMAVLSVLPGAMKSSWGFWIPARFLALKFIPTQYHVVYGNLMSYFWNIIFSLILQG